MGRVWNDRVVILVLAHFVTVENAKSKPWVFTMCHAYQSDFEYRLTARESVNCTISSRAHPRPLHIAHGHRDAVRHLWRALLTALVNKYRGTKTMDAPVSLESVVVL
jgi:hypothetical protein